jgi:hypothetical protein
MKKRHLYSVVISVVALIIAIRSSISSLKNGSLVSALPHERQNFLITDDVNKILFVNQSEPIRVSLIGRSAWNKGYTWTNHDRDIVEISGTGPEVRVTGKRPGKARLTVEHEGTENILAISQLVTEEDPRMGAYITVSDNRITVPPAGGNIVKAVLHNADPSEAEHISWINKSPDIFDVNTDGRVARITGKKQGHGILLLEHELAAYQVAVDVFVGED